jgi:hypothetical protein
MDAVIGALTLTFVAWGMFKLYKTMPTESTQMEMQSAEYNNQSEEPSFPLESRNLANHERTYLSRKERKEWDELSKFLRDD